MCKYVKEINTDRYQCVLDKFAIAESNYLKKRKIVIQYYFEIIVVTEHFVA